MDYQHFQALLEKLVRFKPSVILLVRSKIALYESVSRLNSSQLGPFVDVNHPSIKTCALDEEPSKVFAKHIGTPLLDFLHTSPDTLILLSPSVRDIMSGHPVYPQPELESVFKDPVKSFQVV